ncbi:MAG: SPASM domain-containing protein [Endomicrobium sp.]|jgi:radical SAM protein with 4Fe4S-binding SPASM domain|nr:SPASM domain-containing protein [Endomicrobium sp.]
MGEDKCLEMVCRLPFDDFQVTVDGMVTPCCSGWCKNYKIGNIFDEGIETVWNSKAAKEFRKHILNGSYKFCNRSLCFPQFVKKNTLFDCVDETGFMKRGPKQVSILCDESCNVCCITCRAKPITNSTEYQKKIDGLIESTIIPLCKEAETVSALGAGEIFASKYCRTLIPRLAKVYPTKLKFFIHTNGILCNEKNMRELGIYGRTDGVEVSIHAATKATYDKIVIGGDFEQSWKNVEWLSRLRRTGILPYLGVIFVVHDINFREMKPFLERAISLNVTASFWQYQPWQRDPLSARGKEALVWEPEHPLYSEFKQILSDEIFASPYCNLSGALRAERKGKDE